MTENSSFLALNLKWAWGWQIQQNDTCTQSRLIWVFAGCTCNLVGFVMSWHICYLLNFAYASFLSDSGADLVSNSDSISLRLALCEVISILCSAILKTEISPYCIALYCVVSAIYDSPRFNPRVWALPTPLPSDRIDARHQTTITLTYYLILSMRISLPWTITLLPITVAPYYPKSPFPPRYSSDKVCWGGGKLGHVSVL